MDDLNCLIALVLFPLLLLTMLRIKYGALGMLASAYH
jgi:hypothetical protein